MHLNGLMQFIEATDAPVTAFSIFYSLPPYHLVNESGKILFKYVCREFSNNTFFITEEG